jgi:hypothetical protein
MTDHYRNRPNRPVPFGEWLPAGDPGQSLNRAPLAAHLKTAFGVSIAPDDITLKIMRHKHQLPNYAIFKITPARDGEAFAWIISPNVAALALPATGAPPRPEFAPRDPENLDPYGPGNPPVGKE